MNYREKQEIYDRAKKIIASDLDWKEKYDLIFSKEVSAKFDFEWYDPDLDYEDDVKAFMEAFDKHMEKQKIISEQIDN